MDIFLQVSVEVDGGIYLPIVLQQGPVEVDQHSVVPKAAQVACAVDLVRVDHHEGTAGDMVGFVLNKIIALSGV